MVLEEVVGEIVFDEIVFEEWLVCGRLVERSGASMARPP
jgi:hypothetical protein